MKFWYAELNDDANSPTDGHTFVAGSLDGLKQDIRAWVNGVDGDSFVDVSHVEMGSLTLRNLSAFLANRTRIMKESDYWWKVLAARKARFNAGVEKLRAETAEKNRRKKAKDDYKYPR